MRFLISPAKRDTFGMTVLSIYEGRRSDSQERIAPPSRLPYNRIVIPSVSEESPLRFTGQLNRPCHSRLQLGIF